MDVQGAELIVLQGATKALQEASFVLFESGTIEYNEGSACWYEIDEYLRQHGFYWFDIADIARNPAFKTPGLGQANFMYVKPTSPKLQAYYEQKGTSYCGAQVVRRPHTGDEGERLVSAVVDTVDRLGMNLDAKTGEVGIAGFAVGFSCGCLI